VPGARQRFDLMNNNKNFNGEHEDRVELEFS
jgi:hypothetical protein